MSDLQAKKLRLQAEQMRVMADQLDAQADELQSQSSQDGSEWVFMAALESDYGFTRQSLRAAADSGLPVSRGAKGRIMCRRSDVDRWIASRPWKPGKGSCKPKPGASDLQAAHEASMRALGLTG